MVPSWYSNSIFIGLHAYAITSGVLTSTISPPLGHSADLVSCVSATCLQGVYAPEQLVSRRAAPCKKALGLSQLRFVEKGVEGSEGSAA